MLKNKDGTTALEYGLIAALIGIALITALSKPGASLSNTLMISSKAISSGH